jgi:hypothetical protein
MSNKIFCGRGKRFGQYNAISLSICLDDIPNEYITTGKNGKRYIKLNVNEKREADEWGNTHSVEVDTWKPDNRPVQQFERTSCAKFEGSERTSEHGRCG